MLDKHFILENPDLVQENCAERGVKADVERFVKLDAERKTLLQEVEELSRQANEVSKTIGKAKDAAEREARKEEGRAAPRAEGRPAGGHRPHQRRGGRDPPLDAEPDAPRLAARRRGGEPRAAPRRP